MDGQEAMDGQEVKLYRVSYIRGNKILEVYGVIWGMGKTSISIFCYILLDSIIRADSLNEL